MSPSWHNRCTLAKRAQYSRSCQSPVFTDAARGIYSGAMWFRLLLPLAVLVALAASPGCTKPEPTGREYPLTGAIVAIKADRTEITVNHDEVKGLMAPMTMPFAIKDPALVSGLQAGDRITATLVVTDDEYFLRAISKLGPEHPRTRDGVPAPPR